MSSRTSYSEGELKRRLKPALKALEEIRKKAEAEGLTLVFLTREQLIKKLKARNTPFVISVG